MYVRKADGWRLLSQFQQTCCQCYLPTGFSVNQCLIITASLQSKEAMSLRSQVSTESYKLQEILSEKIHQLSNESLFPPNSPISFNNFQITFLTDNISIIFEVRQKEVPIIICTLYKCTLNKRVIIIMYMYMCSMYVERKRSGSMMHIRVIQIYRALHYKAMLQ